VVGDAPWFGPQTVHEGRPPALMEAGAEGHMPLRCSRRNPTVRATERPIDTFVPTTVRSQGVAQRP
jgi:hypothetical protein